MADNDSSPIFDIESVLIYCKKLKENISNRSCSGYCGFRSVHEKLGDHSEYGYELKPPYTTEEVDTWGVKFPQDFYVYLTQVSRECCFYRYPCEIKKISKIISDNDMKDLESHCVTIGEGGCSFSHKYDFKSGTVYYVDESDEPIWSHIANSFTEYITKNMK